MDTKIELLISKMEGSRARLNAVLEKVTPQTEIYPTWKMKQVLDHIAAWDELVLSTLKAYSHGETPGLMVEKGIDQYNARSISARQELTLEKSRQAYDTARENVLQVLRGLPTEVLIQKFPAPWGGLCTVNSIVKIFISHEQEHAKQIEAILNKSIKSA
jgi:hypothetical protein